MTDNRRLAGRIALVTGASRGIGRAIAKRFAREGAHVILSARTQGALEELDDEIRGLGGQATLVPGDLTDFDRIDHMGRAVFERWKRLDILIGNAGLLGTLTPIAHLDPKVWDQVMAVNVTANYRLIRSFDPLLRASPSGRAIFLSSTAGSEVRAYWSVYGISKAALEMMVKTYAAETATTDVRVNIVNPGATRTAMRAAAMPGEDPETVKPPDSITGLFVDLAAPECTSHGEVFKATPTQS
ncbi:MAG: SDR family NAD(P)-dependent oxidoreductase [Rhodospirillales bacterium]